MCGTHTKHTGSWPSSRPTQQQAAEGCPAPHKHTSGINLVATMALHCTAALVHWRVQHIKYSMPLYTIDMQAHCCCQLTVSAPFHNRHGSWPTNTRL